MSLRIHDKKLLKKYSTPSSKIEILKSIGLNALAVHGNRNITTEIRTCDNYVCIHFPCLNVSEVAVECESFRIIFIDSFLYKSKYYTQVYLHNCAYEILNIKKICETIKISFRFQEWVLQMFHYDRINLSVRFNLPKSNNSNKCIVFHHWSFNHGFKFKIPSFDEVKC